MANCPQDDIVFLSTTASNRPKSDELSKFVAKNRNADLGLVVKREKLDHVIFFFFEISIFDFY